MLRTENLAKFAKYKEFLRVWFVIGIYDRVPHMQEVAGSSPAATTMGKFSFFLRFSLSRRRGDHWRLPGVRLSSVGAAA